MGNWSIILILAALVFNASACQLGDKFFFSDEQFGCQIYYLCEDGEIIELECPPGHAYDSLTKKCLDNSIVKCQESQVPEQVLKRGKRQASTIMRDFMEPVFTKAIASIRNFFTFQEETLTTKVFLPTLFEMVKDAETRWYFKNIVWTLKAGYAPIFSEMLKQQSWDSPPETRVYIPEKLYQDARNKARETLPFINKIARMHGTKLFYRIGDNFELFVDTIERIKAAASSHTGVLTDEVVKFFTKHAELFTSSDKPVRSSFALTEVIKDLKPIENYAIQIFMRYLSESPNPLLNWATNPNSIILKLIMGTGAEIYAVPSNKYKY